MPVEATSVAGLLVVRSDTHGDERGFFRQTWQAAELEDALGRPARMVQANHSRSRSGVLRGFHAEPWDKLVYVVRGTAMTVVADVRPASATFCRTESFHLGDPPGERIRLFVAAGLAHAFCAYGDGRVDYVYDVSREWRSDADRVAIAWDDPDLAVPWPVEDPDLSDLDAASPTLRQLFPDDPSLA